MPAARVADVRPGKPAIAQLAGKEIGVFHEGGQYVAVLNFCPHQGAPVCRGRVGGAVTCDREGRLGYDASRPVLRCPWHHWEFDLLTGRALAAIPQRLKVYPVRVNGEMLEVGV